MSEDAEVVPAAAPAVSEAPVSPGAKVAKASEIAAKLEAKASAEPEASAEEPAESLGTSEQVPTPATPTKSKAETVRERLAERSAARQTQAATRQEQSEIAQLRAELQQAKGPGVDQWLEKLRRDPVAAIREAKADPRQVLDLLTKDAISPGSVRYEHETDGRVKEAIDRAQRVEQQFGQYVQQQAIAAERAAFSEHVSDPAKFPILSKFPPELRVSRGVRKWAELQALGYEYDRDLIADAIEADYEEEMKFHQPAQAASSSTVTPPAAVAAKKPTPKTITADMAGSSGAPRRKTADERKAGIVEKLRRQAAQ
jgi:hypothetical protein